MFPAVLAAVAGCSRTPEAATRLVDLAEVRTDAAVPANITGTVTFHHPGARRTYIQEGAAGAFVRFSGDVPELELGQRLSVSGTARRGGSTITILATQWTPGPMATLPAPVPTRTRRDNLEQRLVTVTGVVRNTGLDRYGMATLDMDTSRGPVQAHVGNYVGFNYEDQLGATVTVSGVLQSISGSDGAPMRADVWVHSFLSQIQVLQPGPGRTRPEARESAASVLTEVRAVKSLPSYQASAGLPVRIRAVVTYNDPAAYTLFVQDHTGGIYVSCHGGQPPPVRAGDLVEVTGVTGAGDFAPVVRARNFRALGRAPLPPPVVPVIERLTAGSYDSELVGISGIARSVYAESGHRVFRLRIPGGIVRVHVLDMPPGRAESLLDARLHVTGVSGAIFNSRRQLLGTQLFVPGPGQVVVEEPPVTPPARIQIAQFLQFSPGTAVGHRVSVRGAVSAWDPVSRTLFMQDGDSGLQVSVPAGSRVKPGDSAEAVGYVASSGISAVLEDAVVEPVRDVFRTPVERTVAAEVLESLPEDRLVELDGTVVACRSTGQILEATLQSDAVRFQAQIPLLASGRVRRAARVSVGDRIRVKGVCVFDNESGARTTAGTFRVIVPDPDAVSILGRAPILSGERALYALALAMFAALVAIVWAGSLRRKVQQQTAVIREQLAEQEKLRVQAESANRAKTDFLANMSHEIRTPMNGVIGFAALALEATDEAQRREYLQTVRESGDLLVSIVNDILDFSKVESGRMTLECIPFDLHDAVVKTVQSFAVRAADKGLRLDYGIAPGVPRHVEGDPLRLRQIVGNLLSNALKFTAEGSVRCNVSASVDGAVASVRIDITDTGIGIAPDKQEKIFEAFTQADCSTTRQFGGTGLGLAISSKLALLAGGRLSVQSEPGAGSTFTFTAPFRLCDSMPSDAPVEEQDHSWLAGLSILVAEDNSVNQRLMSRLLSARGATVAIACDGVAAVEQWKQGRFDLVLMDVQMPEMDGLKATACIRRAEAGKQRTPIVALTADVLPTTRAACAHAGMDGFVTKPVNLADLTCEYRRVSAAREHALVC